jgi:hypothetical protein
LIDGPSAVRFEVKGAFSEYVEVPEQRNELRITLASYGVSCEQWIPPGKDDTAILVTIVTPPGTPPTAAKYPWVGLPAEPTEGAPSLPHPTAYALPKALVGPASRLFEPGGSVQLSRVDVEMRGAIEGTLAFEFPGTADRPATRLDGGFSAALCRISRPSR